MALGSCLEIFARYRGLNIQILDLKTHKTVTVPGSDGLFSPRWSPDGRYIAALSPDLNTVKLFDFKSQKWSDWLTAAAGAVNYPVWSADSKYLYFDDFVNDDESIRRVKVGESQAERVFVLGGNRALLGRIWSVERPSCRRLVDVCARPQHARSLPIERGTAVILIAGDPD